MNPVVYFAEPIDADRRVTVEQQIRNNMLATLLRHGMTIYRPATAWQTGPVWGTGFNPGTARVVEGINRTALDQAHLVVARWPKSISSVGVPMEIEYATNKLGLKVILLSNRLESVSLAANPLVEIVTGEQEFEKAVSHWMRTTPVFTSKPPTEMRFSGPEGAMERAHPGDAGFDLVVTEDTWIEPGTAGRVPCGTAVEFPPGVFGWVVARSSTFDRYDVTILPGIIDTDFRGELFAVALASDPGGERIFISKGSRIAQLVLLPNLAAGTRPVRVDEVSTDTARGSNGFGSTGV